MTEKKQIPELTEHEIELSLLDPVTSTNVSFDIKNLGNKKISQLIRIMGSGKKIKGWFLLTIKTDVNVVHIEAIRKNND